MTIETTPNEAIIKDASQPLYESRNWLKLLGIVTIIQGALAALTLVGIIVAWLPIWMGILLIQAANGADLAGQTGVSSELKKALGSLKTYFIINGVMVLIGLIILALTICGWVVLLASGVLPFYWSDIFNY
jgi:hypothetical protein